MRNLPEANVREILAQLQGLRELTRTPITDLDHINTRAIQLENYIRQTLGIETRQKYACFHTCPQHPPLIERSPNAGWALDNIETR